MPGYRTSRPFELWILTALLILIGLGAVISGAMLFLSPDGEWMGLPVDVLAGSPFSSYLIPGIILFIFIGLFPLMTVMGILQPGRWPGLKVLNPCRNYYWAWAAAWASGLIMLIWILTETLWLGYVSFLQPAIAIWAALILILAFMPRVRRSFRVKGSGRA